jgi:hypothetical protein
LDRRPRVRDQQVFLIDVCANRALICRSATIDRARGYSGSPLGGGNGGND